MSDLYREPPRCLHFDVRGGKCNECGSALLWVVPVENDPSPLIKIKGAGSSQQNTVGGDD